MKDKEEQITEMAKEICSHCLEMAEVCPYANTEDKAGNEACFTERLHEAEKFYNAGYRKISEDSVVLSMEEYERLNECYKVRAFNKLRAENKQLKDRIAEFEKEIEENAFYSKGYAQGIKNTYEVVIPEKLKQFAERLKEELKGIVGANFIDETLKEFIND